MAGIDTPQSGGHGSRVRTAAKRVWGAELTLAGLCRISAFLCVLAAVWFSEGTTRGALVGSLFLAAVLCTRAVTGAPRPGDDTLATWLYPMLPRLGEYIAYAGLAIGGATGGVPQVWMWATGALAALALRDSVRGTGGRLHWLLAFPRPARFAVIALSVVVWDARVTFIALIIGCFVAVTHGLLERSVQRAEGGR